MLKPLGLGKNAKGISAFSDEADNHLIELALAGGTQSTIAAPIGSDLTFFRVRILE